MGTSMSSNHIEGAEVTAFAPDGPGEHRAWRIITPDGVNVMIGRHEDQHGGQLYVSILTEELPGDSADQDAQGEPYMNVSLNGGDVYDRVRV